MVFNLELLREPVEDGMKHFMLICSLVFLTGCFIDITIAMNKGHSGTQPPPPAIEKTSCPKEEQH